MVVEFLVPGFDKKELKLQFNEGILSLKGVRNSTQEVRRYISRNMKILTDLGASVKIGRNLEIETAKYTDGILKVVLKRIDTMDSAPTIPIS